MRRHTLEDLRIVAAWEPDPPPAPWRPLVPVFVRDSVPERVLWPVSVHGSWVDGYEEPATSLEDALAEGRATTVGEPLQARPDHELVRWLDGAFFVVPRNEVVRRRLAEIHERLGGALQCLESGASTEEVQDAFDGACLVHSFDPVATTLRAGAATRRRAEDPAWWSECMDDLDHAVERGGDLVLVRDRLSWKQLPCAPLRESLFRAAREALDDYLRPETDLLPPVSPEVQCAAAATAIWRRRQGRASPVHLPHALLTRVLAGDPDAVAEARPRLSGDPTWERIFVVAGAVRGRRGNEAARLPFDIEGTAVAQAKVTDLDHFARTLHQLEQLSEGPARSASWRSFLQRMQGLDQWRDTRPWRQGELAADELRSRLDLDGYPIAAMSALAASNGVFVGVASLSEGEVDAAATQPRNVPPCLFVNEGAPQERHLRGRFAMAHELCHLLMDRSRTGHNAWVCQTTSRDKKRAVVLDVERRANAFAAYLLAPRDAVRALLSNRPLPSLESSDFVDAVLKVREHFGLTATAAAEHLVNCQHEPGTVEPGRERLPDEIRTRIREASRKTPVQGFGADQEIDREDAGSSATRVRRGRFAQLLRRWVEVGALTRERAASLLGVMPAEVEDWLVPPS